MNPSPIDIERQRERCAELERHGWRRQPTPETLHVGDVVPSPVYRRKPKDGTVTVTKLGNIALDIDGECRSLQTDREFRRWIWRQQ